MALVPLGSLCGAAVQDGNGDAVGKITELMVDGDTGNVSYAVLAHGGVGGLGEKLFAVPWSALRCNTDSVTITVAKAHFEAAEGFDKDAWPAEADASLAQG